MKRPGKRELAAITLGALVVAVVLAARALASSTPPNPGTTGSPLQPSPTTQYWTPERIRSAQPAPMPNPNG